MSEKNIIGENIKRARIKAGLTQEELAKKLSVTASGVGQWERGVRSPRPGTMKSLACVLDTSVSSLLSEKRKSPNDAGPKGESLCSGSGESNLLDYEYLRELEVVLGELKETLSDIISRQGGLTDESQKVVDAYENMNAAGREALMQYAAFLASNPKYQKEKTKDKFKKITENSEIIVEE